MDRRIGERDADAIMRSGMPLSLSDLELQLDVLPLTKTPRPYRVRVWVRYPAGALEVDAVAVAWTPRAVAVSWDGSDETTHRAWAWASAVERDTQQQSQNIQG